MASRQWAQNESGRWCSASSKCDRAASQSPRWIRSRPSRRWSNASAGLRRAASARSVRAASASPRRSKAGGALEVEGRGRAAERRGPVEYLERLRGLAARVLAGQGAGDRLGQDQQHQVAVRLDLGPLPRGERVGQRAWCQAPVAAARREDLHGLAGDVADLLQGSFAAEGEGRGIPVQSPGRRSLVPRTDQRLGEQRRVAVEHQQLVAERAEAGEPLQVRRPGRVLVQPALDVAQLVLDAADEVGEPRLGLQLELRQERGERRFGIAQLAERPLPMAEVDPVHGLQPRRGEPFVPAAGLLAHVGAMAFGRHRQPDRGDQAAGHECGPRRPPPRPLQGALPGGRRPGADRLAGQEPSQVVGQLLGRGVPPRRLLGQALQADRLQVARDPRLEPRRRHHLLVDDLPEGLHDRSGL